VVAESSGVDEAGLEHVRLRQTVGGIPVRYAEMTMHLRGDRLTALHGKTVTDAADVGLSPDISAGAAAEAAADVVRDKYRAGDASFTAPQLELFNRGLLEGARGTTRLAWFVNATAPMLNVYIWVDAQNGAVLFDLNQVPDALNRFVYDQNNNPFGYPGTLVGTEGAPPVSPADAVDVFAYTEHTYNYYLSEHGRDSFDGAGAIMQATVRYCDLTCGCPCLNAFWNGASSVYGAPPFSMDDVVGHEWTHGVTQYEANLIYYKASGALNESFSDIFGEVIDLTNGAGYDLPGSRWAVAESGLNPGGIRNMMTPGIGLGRDPDKVSSPLFYCGENDQGGVHTNSGIGNHGFALMVDGGTFNGFTITGIGLTKAAKIQYRSLTQYLTPTSSFQDNYDALLQSCNDLIGVVGITGADCVEVQKALDSVEMYAAWPRTCGNGTLEVDEECDDGNQIDGDCCSSFCQSAALNDPCSDSDPCSRNDTCLMVGPALACIGTDGPRNDCRGSIDTNTASVSVKDSFPNKKDRLSFTYGKGVQTMKSEFGNPLGSTDYAFCLYESGNTTPVYQASMPAASTCKNGKACWKDTRKGYKYTDGLASRSGVSSFSLNEGLDGKTKISLRAKGDNLAPPSPGTLNPTLTAQIISSSGLCWDAEFPPPATKLTSEAYKDKGE
jgi:cysteine-rich repeat protein